MSNLETASIGSITSAKWRDRAIAEIKKLDPTNIIVEEITNNSIRYNRKNIILKREISLAGDEEIVRALVVCRLHIEYGFPLNSIELEVPYKAGRPKVIKPRIDIIVRDNRKKTLGPAFLFIEVKAPDKFDLDQTMIEGQLFHLALLEAQNGPVKYLVYHSVSIDDLDDRLIIIDFAKYPTFENWQTAGTVSLDKLPNGYVEATKRRYVNVDHTLPVNHLDQPLDVSTTPEAFFGLRKHLHNVLWGGGSMSYNDIFSNLIKLFLAKIYDEETTDPGALYRFQILFDGDDPEPPETLFGRIDALYNECRELYLGYTREEIAQSVGIDRDKISAVKVTHVVGQLQGISLRENKYTAESDILGDFFEGIVSDGFKQDKGQFFTHRNIVKFMLDVLQIKTLARELVRGKENPAKPRLPYICDPSCGSGAFLISAMKEVSAELAQVQKTGGLSYKTKEFLASNFPPFTPNVWAKEFIYGIEPHGDLAMATKVNMVLHGDGNINVFRRSGLLPFSEYRLAVKASVLAQNHQKPLDELKGFFRQQKSYYVNEQFDIIITNPPFSVDLDQETKKTLSGNFLFATRPNSEVIFVERWFQLLREEGRLAAVLPDSIFDNKEDVDIRIFLYRFFHLKALVSLPMLAFQPYTPTKTSILFAKKKTGKEIEVFDTIWNQESKNTDRLIDVLLGWNFSSKIDSTTADAIKLILGLQVPEEELKETSMPDLVVTYTSILKEAIENPHWITFSLTIPKLDSTPFLVAHAEHIGFKRSKKAGEMPRQNQLYHDAKGLITDDVHPDYARIIDFIENKISW